MVVPSPPFCSRPRWPEMEPLSKESLRRAALDARKAFVATLSDGRPGAARAAPGRAPDFALRRAPRWSAAMRRWAARSARCWRWRKRARSARIVAFPAFDQSRQAVPIPRRRSARAPARSGSCSPSRSAPVVEPDLILVPLIAIDGRGTRLGRGKGHYDRALARLRKRRRATDRRRLAAAAPQPKPFPPTNGTSRSTPSLRPRASNCSFKLTSRGSNATVAGQVAAVKDAQPFEGRTRPSFTVA